MRQPVLALAVRNFDMVSHEAGYGWALLSGRKHCFDAKFLPRPLLHLLAGSMMLGALMVVLRVWIDTIGRAFI